MTGKMTLNPADILNTDGTKAVQVKVPVVATVIQNIESDGKSTFIIEPPGSEQEQGRLSRQTRKMSQMSYLSSISSISDNSLVTTLDSQLSFPEFDHDEPNHRQNGPNLPPSIDDCNELLELAAQGGIQFVRAMEDGRYEVTRKQLLHVAYEVALSVYIQGVP